MKIEEAFAQSILNPRLVCTTILSVLNRSCIFKCFVENLHQTSSQFFLLRQFHIPSVEGESPYGQVDSLLVSRLLRPRQKVLNMDTDFLLDPIKLMNEREGERYVPY
jgi:hypothetical protein